jgi:adenylate cyclase
MELPSDQDIRLQLERICASQKFRDAVRSKRFLKFVVDEALAGRSSELKENVVGVSVFDRSPHYDPRLDSIVRVEAGRLRSKLSDYYKEIGCDDPVQILLSKGSYAPEFLSRASATARTQADAGVTMVAATSSVEKRTHRHKLWVAGGIIAIVVVVGVGLASNWTRRSETPEIRIAVLPFTAFSDEKAGRAVAAQLTEKVTAEFVKIGTFNVVPSTSARQYEDRRPGVREIASALHADILLEAKTVQDPKGVRVEVRLSDGAMDRKFWVRDEYAGDNLDKLAGEIAVGASTAVSTKWKRSNSH